MEHGAIKGEVIRLPVGNTITCVLVLHFCNLPLEKIEDIEARP